jgi:serine/threonine-protein kinase
MAKKKDGRSVGRYRILDELGRGAMGVVYRAEDPSLDRIVALKTISLGDADEDRKAYEKRFLLEAKAAGKLTHPNIVTIFDYGEEEDIAYMAMELLEGQDLRSRMRQGEIPPMEAVEIALQVADGLGFAHEFGVVHRDVKPGNIMLLERGAVKIMDFGIARMRFAEHKTSTGMVLGTPRYMSPEQIGGQPVDQRSDIFSLGTVLYEMLTQVSLFAGQDVSQIAHNVATSEPAPPSRLHPELPQMLDFIVARALKKDPAVRYQDAYEMAADLRDVLAEMRGRAPSRDRGAVDEREKTQTLKIPAGADKLPVAPAANAIARETKLPLSHVFSSDEALERVEARAKRERFNVPPKRVGIFRRFLLDRLPRRLLVVAVVAAAVGSWIAVG